MLSTVRASVAMIVLFTLLTGLAYPLAMTGIAGVAFPAQATGSLVRDASGKVIGSTLLAQGFSRPEYLHPRPSAAGAAYDPLNSGGSNLGPLDPKLTSRMTTDAATYRKDNPRATVIPADALTTSASGLDPDVSPANAQMQAPRIAAARGAAVRDVLAIIASNTAQPSLGFLGDARVNVLAVNRALDARYPLAHPKAK